MKVLDEYIESIIKYYDKGNVDLGTFKEEIKEHLNDKTEELMKEGYSEEESIEIAKREFGTPCELEKDFSSLFKVKNRYSIIVIISSIVTLAILFIKSITNNLYTTIEGKDFFIISFVIYLILLVVRLFSDAKNNIYINKNNVLFVSIVNIYLIFIISKLIFPIFIDFNSIGSTYIELNFSKYYLKNVILYYIPFGIFIPMIFNIFRNFKLIFIPGAILLSISFIGSIMKYLVGKVLYINLSLYILMIIGGILGSLLFIKIYECKMQKI